MAQDEIYAIEDVRATRSTAAIIIAAHGWVTTSGWKNAQLVLRPHTATDEMFEFDFVAEPPASGTIVLQVLTRIGTVFIWSDAPKSVRAIRVLSRTNNKEAPVLSSTQALPLEFHSIHAVEGGPGAAPFPWRVAP